MLSAILFSAEFITNLQSDNAQWNIGQTQHSSQPQGLVIYGNQYFNQPSYESIKTVLNDGGWNEQAPYVAPFAAPVVVVPILPALPYGGLVTTPRVPPIPPFLSTPNIPVFVEPFAPEPVPEPKTFLLVAAGLAAAAWRLRR